MNCLHLYPTRPPGHLVLILLLFEPLPQFGHEEIQFNRIYHVLYIVRDIRYTLNLYFR